MVNANAPVTPVLPVPVTDTTSSGIGFIGAPGFGFKGRTGSRSNPKTGSHLQNANKPGVAGAVVSDGAKPNQSKDQAEKKNQASSQLRKMLILGNKRVEALATVIQHLFTEVFHSYLQLTNEELYRTAVSEHTVLTCD